MTVPLISDPLAETRSHILWLLDEFSQGLFPDDRVHCGGCADLASGTCTDSECAKRYVLSLRISETRSTVARASTPGAAYAAYLDVLAEIAGIPPAVVTQVRIAAKSGAPSPKTTPETTKKAA